MLIVSLNITPASAATYYFGNQNQESWTLSIEDTVRGGGLYSPAYSGTATSIKAYINVDLDFAFGHNSYLDLGGGTGGESIINAIRGSVFTCTEDGNIASITAYIYCSAPPPKK